MCSKAVEEAVRNELGAEEVVEAVGSEIGVVEAVRNELAVEEAVINELAVEEAVRNELGLTQLQQTGISGRGCISSGSAYDTDKYGRVFIKVNSRSKARQMFDGEHASLESLYHTNTVRVPKPIKVVDLPEGGAAIVTDFLDMRGRLSKHSATLGDQMARLHLHNASLKEKTKTTESSIHKGDYVPMHVSQFGFHVNTFCGVFEMDNTWMDDWPSFYARRTETCVKLLEINEGDRLVRELWNKIVPKMSRIFDGINIEPAFLHGDLWSGNITETDEGPAIFDPTSFYGHSEMDISKCLMFGGFSSEYYSAYHSLIPKATGFEKRKDLYKAFYHINNWNHFGEKYKSYTLSTLQDCVQHVYN